MPYQFMTIFLDLTGDAERKLAEIAQRLKVPVGDLAAAAVRDLLSQPAADYEKAVQHVLNKNEALYRRLA